MLNRTFLSALVFSFAFNFLAFAEEEVTKWNGDFRYRHEFVSQEEAAATAVGQPSVYNQAKMRARLGLALAINEDVDAEFRLATGTGRVSTNQIVASSSNAFANYALMLDRAGFKWRLTDFMTFSGGRLGNSFFEAGESDLIWDLDLNFDGLTLGINTGIDRTHFFMNAGHYWIDKASNSTALDVTMVSAQAGIRRDFSEDSSASIGAVVHHISNLRDHLLIGSPLSPAGNSVTGTGASRRYTSDFNLINPGIEFQTRVLFYPTVFYVDYVVNGNATTNNAGYMAGLKFGKVKQKGDFAFWYDYRELKKDAAVAAFVDGDCFLTGGTNGRNHRVSLAYGVGKNSSLAFTGYFGKIGISEGETAVRRNKVHIDLSFKF